MSPRVRAVLLALIVVLQVRQARRMAAGALIAILALSGCGLSGSGCPTPVQQGNGSLVPYTAKNGCTYKQQDHKLKKTNSTVKTKKR